MPCPIQFGNQGGAMLRVLHAAAILLSPALRHPWQESVPELLPAFYFPLILVLVSLIYRGTGRERSRRRVLWFLGVLGLGTAIFVIAVDVMARGTDTRSVAWITGWLLVGIFSIVAARKTPPAASDRREDVARATN